MTLTLWLTTLAVLATPEPVVPAQWSAVSSAQILIVAGDLLLIRGQPIRLAGVAAPDPAQRCDAGRRFVACGAAAAHALRELIGAQSVSCRILGPVATPWVVAQPVWVGVCQAGSVDLAGAMVEAGEAVPAPQSPHAAAGLDACVGRRGIWASSLENPWTFAARRDGADIAPVFIGARSGTPCVRALSAPRSLIPR